MTLAELLKTARVKSGMTLQETADACGLTKGHLHDLESGRHINPGLSVALGLIISAMASAVIESNVKRTS